MKIAQEGLKREVGVWGLSANIVNIIVGAGIFVLPAIVAEIMGTQAVIAYLFCGFLIALVMLCWFLVCVLRTVTVEFHEDWILSGYLVSQVLWPGIMAAYGLLAITGYLEETQQRLWAEIPRFMFRT